MLHLPAVEAKALSVALTDNAFISCMLVHLHPKQVYNLINLDVIVYNMNEANRTYSLSSFFVLFYSFGWFANAAAVWKTAASAEKREIVLGADHRERKRARMPPPPVVCPGCQAHAQHARPHAGAQAGRKRQSSWKSLLWSEPTPRWCQAEQLWPASARASLSYTRRHTADLRRKDATIRGPLVHPGPS